MVLFTGAGRGLRRELALAFAMLAPDDCREGVRYTLYLKLASQQGPRDDLVGLALDLARRLSRNVRYEYCRRLGQLSEPAILRTGRGALAG